MPEPFPLPGSAEARARGCTCWVDTPGMGIHRPPTDRAYWVQGGHVYTYDCPLHRPEGKRWPRKGGTLSIDNLNEIRAVLSNVALEGNKKAVKLLEYIDAGQTVEERMRRAERVWEAIESHWGAIHESFYGDFPKRKGRDEPRGGDG